MVLLTVRTIAPNVRTVLSNFKYGMSWNPDVHIIVVLDHCSNSAVLKFNPYFMQSYATTATWLIVVLYAVRQCALECSAQNERWMHVMVESEHVDESNWEVGSNLAGQDPTDSRELCRCAGVQGPAPLWVAETCSCTVF